jgi:predicted ATPase/class 3 adenylate cyclase
MPDLPTGTVVFLFTDVEGSTQAWERDPAATRSALERQDVVVRESVATHRGHVFKTVGDGYCIAFHTPADAVAAAVAAQRGLAAQPAGETKPLRVRMALHVGAAEARNGDYLGAPLNRVARLLATGHGGQILVSQAVYDLVRDALPGDVALRDLGQHSLKDLQHPEQVYQLLHPHMAADFPPLRSLNVLPNNLPPQLTSFIGRETEMAEVKRLLAGTRLLTLTGAGGSGKTRLALQVAADLLDDYTDGVWFVELATLTEPSLVPQRVASVLGVREQQGRPLLDTLADALRPKKLLILLDSCEHLLQGCVDLVSRLLLSCPGVKLLATSREALNATGEASWTVPLLSAPDPRSPEVTHADPAKLNGYEAVRLFVDRARLSKSDFALTERNGAAVAQICHRLDGIPLGIELAAARVKVLSVEQIASRLDDRFRLLTGGSRMVLPRHQTLRAAIDWSFDLLSDQERLLLRRLSVFAGWTLEAAEKVCQGEGIEGWEVLELQAHLVEKSLVLVEEGPGGEARYRLLGTIRQYARDRLIEAGEAAAVRDRHRNWFLELAERAATELRGPEQALWLDRLEQEHDNLRAALEWSQGSEEAGDAGLRLAGSLYRFWYVRGYLAEGRQWLEEALVKSGGAAGPARGRALHGAGYLAWSQGDFQRASPLLEESLTIYRQLGDKRGLARTLNSVGVMALELGQEERARSLWEEGLAMAREIAATELVTTLLNNLGETARIRGDFERARALYQESLELGGGALTDMRATCLGNLGLVASAQSDWDAARSFFLESVTLTRKLGDKANMACCLEGLAGVYAMQGQPEDGARFLGAAEAVRKAINSPIQSGERTDYDRSLAAVRGALDKATFARAWNEGAAMAVEEAVEYALSRGSDGA